MGLTCNEEAERRAEWRAERPTPFLVVSPEREARVREADALAGVRARLPETKPHTGRQTSTHKVTTSVTSKSKRTL